MAADFAQVLEDKWQEYEWLHEHGEVYSAAIGLAEIENVLEHWDGDSCVREQWELRLRGVELSPRALEAVGAGIASAVRRLRRILGVGTRFLDEELILVITMRVELDVLCDFLEKRGLVGRDSQDLAGLDGALRKVARSKINRSSFLKAQAACRKNWGIPLQSGWLDPEAIS